MLIGTGYDDRFLSEAEVRALMTQALERASLSGKRLLIIIPDGTRTVPIPLMFRLFYELLGQQVATLDYLIALGTHMAMDDEAINERVGITAEERATTYASVNFFNHHWDRPETFVKLGQIPAAEMEEMTGGMIMDAVDVRINKMIFDYDQVIICGPTYPHEIVGFSGGNKYFFPGIGGAEVIDFTHWLGALITNYEIIGTIDTPVRRVIDRAATFVDMPKLCFSMVVKLDGKEPRLGGLYIGTPEEAFAAAAALSSKLHIVWTGRTYKRVLAVMPTIYDDIWTASKGMYKVEPVVEDGGEVILYAPHIDEISYSHGRLLDEIGYHVRDYYTSQWDRFKSYPGSVLTHSTLLRGLGQYEPKTDAETPRIQVTLASGVPEDRCRRVNLGYMDPESINPDEWRGREDEGILFIPKAGETLYRLKQ